MLSKIQNMKIPARLAFYFSLIGVVTAVVAAVSFLELFAIQKAENEFNEAARINSAYRDYSQAVESRREQVVFYILSGDRKTMEGLGATRASVDAARVNFDKVVEETSIANSMADTITAMHKDFDDYEAFYVTPQTNMMRNAKSVNDARVLEVTGDPLDKINEFREDGKKVSAFLVEAIEAAAARKEKAIFETFVVVGIGIGIVLLLLVAVGVSLTHTVARPIAHITSTMRKLADGDNEVDIPGAGRKDEVGEMAGAVDVFKKNAIERVRLEVEEKAAQEVEAKRQRALEELTQKFSGTASSLSQEVSEALSTVTATVDAMLRNAENTGVKAETVSIGAGEASANIQTVSAATTELSASISEISNQVSRAAEISREAVREAEDTNQRVTALSESADRIGAVIKLIQDIAEQTNLLALNATIEAARAGEAGRGFAVVAAEVKNLANQTAKATEEITGKIAEIQSETGLTATAISKFGNTIRQIDELSTNISAAIEEQGAATAEIARNVESASAGTSDITESIADVATAANDTEEQARGQGEAISTLDNRNTSLHGEIRSFLDKVSAI